MKKSFTLGAIAGATSLAVAVPVIAQMVSAASEPAFTAADMPVPSQACVQAMADQETAHLSSMNSMHAAMKTASAARRDALASAAKVADDTARQEAVKQAQMSFREAMKAAMEAQGDRSAGMEALKTACGDHFPMMGMAHGMGRNVKMFNVRMKGDFAEKLGMTEDELKAALESGKTIQDLAEEKGIELPAPRMFRMKRGGGGMMHFAPGMMEGMETETAPQ